MTASPLMTVSLGEVFISKPETTAFLSVAFIYLFSNLNNC